LAVFQKNIPPPYSGLTLNIKAVHFSKTYVLLD
jgi:hypothetical protein